MLVFGAAGRMGKTVIAAVDADSELELAAAVDPAISGPAISDPAISGPATPAQTATSTADIDPASINVAVDFTVAAAARDNALWCAQHGIHAVIGTTGLTETDLAKFETAFAAGKANCLVAPNFAVGAVLLMRFAELAAPHFGTAEIIEQHHDDKVDAPSGTALKIAERIAAASDQWHRDPTQHEIVPGARGARAPAVDGDAAHGDAPVGIPVHSVRLRGLVAHHQVLFGSDGEVLTLRHDSLDRSSFMGGVLHACKVIADHPGLTVGLGAYFA